MRWPFRRRSAERAAPAPQARRPSREWAGLPPLRPVGLRPEPEVASAARFQAGLSTRWQQAPILAPLAHGLTLSAPAGLTSGVVTPVTGYADAPELRFQEPSALPQLPVVGETAPKPSQALISYESPPVTAIRSASRLPEPAADPEPSLVRELAPQADVPPVAAEPAEPPPPPVEPAPRARRLGRLGPPLNIDAVPPAVLRPEPALVEPNLAPPQPLDLEPPPLAPVAPVTPPGLGVPEWFATPSTDPDEPVAASWVAPLERADSVAPDVSTPYPAQDSRRAEPTTGPPARPDVAEPAAELPFRPFRRFGPGPQPEPVPERAPDVPDDAVEAFDVEPARVVDEPPRAAQPAVEAPAEPLPVVAARPLPQLDLPERPLASVRPSLSFLPSEGVALLPGLTRQPDPVAPAPRAAEPTTEPPPDEWLPIPDFANFQPAAPPQTQGTSADPFDTMPGATAMPAWPAELGPQPDWYSPPPPTAAPDAGPTARTSFNAMPDLPARQGFRSAAPAPGFTRGPMPGHAAMPGTPEQPRYPAIPGFAPFTDSAAMPTPSAMPPQLPDLGRFTATPDSAFEAPRFPEFSPPPYAPTDAPFTAVTSDDAPADAPPRRRIGHIGPPVAEPRAEPPPAHDRDWPDHAPLPHPVPMPGLPAPHQPATPLAHSQASEDDGFDPDDDAPPDGERLDNLAGELYDRIRDRLRRELLVDRERAVMLTDWR